MHFTTRIVSVLATTLALAACSSDASEGTIAKGTVETGAMDALTKKTGQQAPQITCPGDMPAKVGASMVCSIPLSNGTYDVTVTVTAVNGTTAQFSVEVAAAPRG
jgi:major membrane immunogen (membrane-anchored lipoprotein)